MFLVLSNGIAAFTFDTVHTAILLEIFVIKRIYELFYAIEFFVEQCLHKLFCQTETKKDFVYHAFSYGGKKIKERSKQK